MQIQRFIILGLMVFFFAAPPASADTHEQGLYRLTLIRAAAGKWVELKALIEAQGEAGTEASEGRVIPYRMRHSQGDHWDFMLLQPVNDFGSYLSSENQMVENQFRDKVATLADFEEDWFIEGPSHTQTKAAFAGAGMFHVEMFRARADMKDELIDQRMRENGFLAAVSIPANAVFIGKFGADWDVMTIGYYADLAAFAAPNGHTDDEEDQAARDNGFNGIWDIAPYLRSLLVGHNDTLAVAMK